MKKIIISGLLVGVALLITEMAFSYLVNYLSSAIKSEYQNINLFRPWSDPLMSLYFVYPFIAGLALAFFWHKTKQVFKGSGLKRAINFGWWYFLIATLPGMWITYSSFQVSLGMVISWTAVGFVEVVVAALIFDKLDG